MAPCGIKNYWTKAPGGAYNFCMTNSGQNLPVVPEKDNEYANLIIPTIDHFDKTNHKSLYNLLPEEMRKKYDAFEEEITGYMSQDEADIEAAIESGVGHMRKYRLAFWKEYSDAALEGRKMLALNIFGRVTSYNTYLKRVLRQPPAMAFIFSPPPCHKLTEAANMEGALALLNRSLTKANDYLTYKDPKGNDRFDTSLLTKIFDIAKWYSDKVHGPVATRNINLNVNKELPASATADIGKTTEQLRQEVLNKSRALNIQPETIEINSGVPVEE